MSVEFVDTNVFVYAHDGGAGVKHTRSVEALGQSFRKPSRRDEQSGWTLHRPSHADLIRAAQLHRRHKISWWDALIITSAIQLECDLLWSEDLSDGQRYETVTIRNPFMTLKS
jgi:predicted nucleic acid-binding protein